MNYAVSYMVSSKVVSHRSTGVDLGKPGSASTYVLSRKHFKVPKTIYAMLHSWTLLNEHVVVSTVLRWSRAARRTTVTSQAAAT